MCSDVAVIVTSVAIKGDCDIVLCYVRDAALAWIEHWCESNDAFVGHVLAKALELSHGGGGVVSGDNEVAIIDWPELLRVTPDYDCGWCGARCRSLCMGIGCTKRYCSRKCQVADWPSHKTECRNAGAAKFGRGMFADFVQSGEHGGDAFCAEVHGCM